MNAQSHNRGFTKIELVIVLVVLALFFAVSIPAVLRARLSARRNACLHNLKLIGRAFQTMDSTQRRFPSSCGVAKDPNGKILSMDGWSWCIFILPYVEMRPPLCEILDMRSGKPLDGSQGSATALSTLKRVYHCPSFKGNPYVDMRTRAEAITNYKAMGGTHLESLNVASPSPTVPRYGDPKDHPDGGCYPGSTHGTDGFSKDGTAGSVLVAETVEQNVARWTVGNEACLVGLPPVVTFEESGVGGIPYVHPTGFTVANYWDKSTIPNDVNKTYLDWDYEKHPYSDGGVSKPSAAASVPMKHGPSSHHAGVTNHLLADGSVQCVCEDIDAALYMFLITRNNGDVSRACLAE